jgi:hypothetical protein
VHQLSIRDFEEFCVSRGFEILGRKIADPARSPWKQAIVRRFPNLLAVTPVYLLRKSGRAKS